MSKMRIVWNLAGAVAALAAITLSPNLSSSRAWGQQGDSEGTPRNSVLTSHNDNARSGLFPYENILTPANVTISGFGKLFSQAVDGYVYAQPLYVPKVVIPGKGTHNVVYVATEHDSVYAFDADTAAGGTLWKTSLFTGSGETSVPSADVGTGDLVPEIGITSTPVISYPNATIFVEAKTKLVVNGVATYIHRLHALDMTTGLEKPHSPVVITGTVKGTGDGNDGNGNVPFNPLRQHVRPALLLNNGVVYVASASHGDIGPYHGWVFGYNQLSLKQIYMANYTPNGGLGGIWQAGGGMVADTLGNMYFATGNGTFSADPSLGNGIDYGDSYLRVAPNVATGKLLIQDFFTPFNEAYLDAIDGDLGSGGCLIPPEQSGKYPNILIGCGKEGRIYVINRDNMSHFHADGDHVIQTIPNAIGGSWSMPAYFNNAIYYNGQGDILKSFSLSGGLLSTLPISQSKISIGYPGATPSISANGTTNGIVWVIQSDAYGSGGPAILHAFDATNLARELYNTSIVRGARDVPGGAAVKFTVPTVAGGKVYIGTSNQLTVYGLLR